MKKKCFKLIMSLMSISLLLIPFPASVTAQTVDKTNVYDSVLLENGYPQFVIDEMSENEKQELYDLNAVFESYKSTFYDSHGNIVAEQTVNDDYDENKIIQRGQIKDTSLKLSWTISNSGINKVVKYKYKWLVLPVNRWQDPVGISWDDVYFQYVSGSFSKVDEYEFKIDNEPIRLATHSSAKNFANGSKHGITWYADLKGHSSSMMILGLQGYGTVTLKPLKSGTSNVFGHYVHSRLAFTISMTTTGAGSFSISGTGYDEMGNSIALSVKL